MPGARKDAISWSESFMGTALVMSQRSKDPKTQVGACIVSIDNRILTVGYNGAPNGYDDDDFPWESSTDGTVSEKHYYGIHAERNAFSNYIGSRREFEGGTMYVTHFPCSECAKDIVQSGLIRVVYLTEWRKRNGESLHDVTLKLLQVAGIKLEHMPLTSYVEALKAL